MKGTRVLIKVIATHAATFARKNFLSSYKEPSFVIFRHTWNDSSHIDSIHQNIPGFLVKGPCSQRERCFRCKIALHM